MIEEYRPRRDWVPRFNGAYPAGSSHPSESKRTLSRSYLLTMPEPKASTANGYKETIWRCASLA